jgi:8-oxo-dGTP diphosphatase
VVDDRGRLLFGRRLGPRGAGRLAVPGGEIHPGESFAAAAAREVLEETGLAVRVVPFSQVHEPLFVVNHAGPAGDHYVVAFLECRVAGGVLETREPDKCGGWAWRTYADLAAQVSPGAVAAWQAGVPHEDLAWVPLPQLHHFRDHLGLT